MIGIATILSSLGSFGKIIKSPLTPWILLAIVGVVAFIAMKGCNDNKKGKNRWKENYNAVYTFTKYKAQEVIVEKQEMKKLIKEDEELRQIIKEAKTKPNKVEYIYQVKWHQGATIRDTIRDTVFLVDGEMMPGETLDLVDTCMSLSYWRYDGDVAGSLSYNYNGQINVVGSRELRKPKFVSWWKNVFGGNGWEYTVTVKSPCFQDTSIILNKMIRVK